MLIILIVLLLLFGGGGWYYGGPHIGGSLGGLLLVVLLVIVLACFLAGGALVAEATTRTQDAAMSACLRYAHAKNVETYCALKRGTGVQKACVKKAETTEGKRACLAPVPR